MHHEEQERIDQDDHAEQPFSRRILDVFIEERFELTRREERRQGE